MIKKYIINKKSNFVLFLTQKTILVSIEVKFSVCLTSFGSKQKNFGNEKSKLVTKNRVVSTTLIKIFFTVFFDKLKNEINKIF